MIYPQPKPEPKPKKQKTRLKVNKPLRAKNKNPLPKKTKLAVLNRDKWQCQHCGSVFDLTIHHITKRSQASKEWVHDERNLETLCVKCHGLTESSHKFFLARQRLAVARFGWFTGQAMTVEEWEDKYERQNKSRTY